MLATGGPQAGLPVVPALQHLHRRAPVHLPMRRCRGGTCDAGIVMRYLRLVVRRTNGLFREVGRWGGGGVYRYRSGSEGSGGVGDRREGWGGVGWDRKRVQGAPRGCQGGTKGMPRGYQADAKGVPRGCQGGAKGVPRGCRGGAEMVTRVHQGASGCRPSPTDRRSSGAASAANDSTRERSSARSASPFAICAM